MFSLFLGIFLLYIGSELLLKGGVSFATRLKISPLVIGLTLVAFGTGSPELFVSVKASLAGHSDISVGDIVGSNIFNIGGILGFCACFASLPLKEELVRFDLPVAAGAYFLLFILCLVGKVSEYTGLFFLLLGIGYTLMVYMRKRDHEAKSLHKPLKSIFLDILFIAIGLFSLIYGSHTFVIGALQFSDLLGLTELNTGLGIVAIGTSLPEVSFCLVALWKKQYDILIGNIVGSNIFNIFFVLGTASLINPFKTFNLSLLDLGMLLLTLLSLFPLFKKNLSFSKTKGRVIFLTYCIYLFSLYF